MEIIVHICTCCPSALLALHVLIIHALLSPDQRPRHRGFQGVCFLYLRRPQDEQSNRLIKRRRPTPSSSPFLTPFVECSDRRWLKLSDKNQSACGLACHLGRFISFAWIYILWERSQNANDAGLQGTLRSSLLECRIPDHVHILVALANDNHRVVRFPEGRRAHPLSIPKPTSSIPTALSYGAHCDPSPMITTGSI